MPHNIQLIPRITNVKKYKKFRKNLTPKGERSPCTKHNNAISHKSGIYKYSRKLLDARH